MLNNNIDGCIICLDGEEAECENMHLPIDNINELEKSCLCKYSVHKNCIQEWLQKKPVCVMCNLPLYYIESNVHHQIPEGSQLCSNENSELDNIEPTTAGFYRCILTGCLCVAALIIIYNII